MKKFRLLLTHLLLVAMLTTTVSPAYVYADVVSSDKSVQEAGDAVTDPADEGDKADETDEKADGADETDADVTDADAVEEDAEDADEADADAADPDAVDEDAVDPDADADDAEEIEELDDPEADEAEILDPEEAETVTEEIGDGSITKPAVTYTKEITKIDPPEKTDYTFEYKEALVSLLEELPGTLTIWHEKESKTIEVIWKSEEDYDDAKLYKYHFVPDLDGYKLAKDLELPVLNITFEGDRPEYPVGGLERDEASDVSIPYVEEEEGRTGAGIPSYYNVWKQGKLPKVRNQNPYGTCWAHATIACMEADLIHDKKASTSIDLSELHMAYFAGHYVDPKNLRKDKVSNNSPAVQYLDNGGWINTGTHLLANRIGAVKESVAPYSKAKTYKAGKNQAVAKDTYQLAKAYFYNTNDRAGIKKAIMDHGGAMAGYSHSNTFYSSYYNSYYNPYWNFMGGGHQITLVGWDDNFPKTNFSFGTPSGNGAWLVRNSWGSNKYDLNGYFWMSYYDPGLLNWSECVVALDAVKTQYKNCYSYAGQNNWDRNIYVSSPATAKVSYKVSGGEAINAVGFEIKSSNVDAKVTVKNKKTGKSSTGTVHCTSSGFYTVNLKSKVPVPKKAQVEVTVKLTSKSGGYVYVVAEDNFTGSRGSMGMYFATKCDKGFTLNGRKQNNDPRIALYTVKNKAPKNVKVKSISMKNKSATLTKGATLTLKYTIKPSNATNKKVTWSSSNKKVATVTNKGKVKGVKAGKATITVKTKDGGKKATCKVTVKNKKVKVRSVSLPKKKTVKKGKKIKLKATIKPSNATNKKVTWSSGNKKIATVTSKGEVKGIKPGTVKIKVKTKDGNKKATCTVTVTK